MVDLQRKGGDAMTDDGLGDLTQQIHRLPVIQKGSPSR
jgi:hypothetical protein